MKTLVLSMISIAATLAAMTACTSEGDPIDEGTKDTPVEIKMSAGVLNIVTKSDGPINGLTSAITDVAFLSQENTEGQGESIVWTGITPTTHEASIATTGAITFTDATKPYYSSDVKKHTYLVGYHPNSGSFSSIDGSVTFNITGKQDIMYASVVHGNKETNKAANADDKLLQPKFKHLLAQLKIQVEGNTAAAEAWGEIKSIKVKDARTELKLDAKAGTLSEGTANVQNIQLIDNTAIAIPTTAESAGYSMVLPRTAQYFLVIETDKVASREVAINIPEDSTEPARAANETRAGEAYTITLTFSASEISATATVDPWTNVSGGTGTVD